jgi:hypothetical protein
MPAEGLPWLPKSEILSYEEIAGVVGQLAPLGLRRLRITGGEPTIRPDLDQLIRLMRAVPEIEDIALSTNGARLPELAPGLRDAGLVGLLAGLCGRLIRRTLERPSGWLRWRLVRLGRNQRRVISQFLDGVADAEDGVRGHQPRESRCRSASASSRGTQTTQW